MEPSAVTGAAGSMHGFPAALTSFVGRAQVMDEIAGHPVQYRLVTVTGPGGAGKTRLGGEVARRVSGRFADGVWLAELAAVRDPVQVAAAVALGIRELPSVAAADALARALAGRQLLLVLDNCEHVIGAAAELCGRLLVGADDIRVLDWALERDGAVAPRLAAALAWWWQIRGRLAGQVPLLRAAVDRAAAGSDAWCAGHAWLGQASLDSADPAGALHHFTAVLDAIGDHRPVALLSRCLSGRSAALLGMGLIAERTCAAGLASARDAGDLWSLGNLLEKMVVLDLGSGRYRDAAAHLREALQTALRTGVRRKALEDLDCCGYLCARTGLSAEAVTVWAAVAALERDGFSAPLRPELPEGWPQRQAALREVRQALGPTRTQAAEERGTAMSLATAAEYVLMLTAAGLEPEPPAAAPGAEALSPRERELVTLVARGHTDTQIAGLLSISVRTVSSHLDRIRDKTGCRRRADLTRLALSAGLV